MHGQTDNDDDKSWDMAQETADEMEREDTKNSIVKHGNQMSTFNMRDIHRLSYEDPHRLEYSDSQQQFASNKNNAAKALAQPTPPVEQKSEKKAEVTQQATGGPQSGSPISDAVLDGLKKMTGKGEDKATAQVSEASNNQQTQSVHESVHDKLEEKVFQSALEYQKFADKQSQSFSKNLDQETLSADYLKE